MGHSSSNLLMRLMIFTTSYDLKKYNRGLIICVLYMNSVHQYYDDYQDIHTANERRLTEIIGKVGGKLHTGRSRNDQVATDVRLWLRSKVSDIVEKIADVIMIATEVGEKNIDILQAGFTHLQPAQVVRFSHWLMSHTVPLMRDMERLVQLLGRVNICPLGSGALAGHPFGLDRDTLASSLGFSEVSLNSLDATSDRDFIAEFMSSASLLMVSIRRLNPRLILHHIYLIYCSYCTVSSIPCILCRSIYLNLQKMSSY